MRIIDHLAVKRVDRDIVARHPSVAFETVSNLLNQRINRDIDRETCPLQTQV
jgi:hypothetical protein